MSKDSASLKDEGNKAFAAAQYREAVNLYTSALASSSTDAQDVENLAALYSNRCAAYVHLFEYDRGLSASFSLERVELTSFPRKGLLDGDHAVKLRNEWDRAYARRAECYAHLVDFDSAKKECERFSISGLIWCAS